MGRVFILPINCQHPPAASIVEKLKAVDAPGKGFLAFGVAGLIGAPRVGDVVPNLNAVSYGGLIKAFFVKERLGPLNVFFHRENAGSSLASLVTAGGNEARSRVKERTKAVPVACA